MELSFGRAIKVEPHADSSTINDWKKINQTIDSTIDTMNGKTSSVYDKETSEKVGKFLRGCVGDYTPETGVFLRRINNSTYLFTGKEALEARKICEESENQTEKYYKLEGDFPTIDCSKMEEAPELGFSTKRDCKLLDLVEDGAHGKANSKLKLKINAGGKPFMINYETYQLKRGESRMEERSVII